ARKQIALLLAPLIGPRRHPARFPEVEVEMDQGKAGLRRERPRERALARSGHASDHNAAADRSRGSDPLSSTFSAHLTMFAGSRDVRRTAAGLVGPLSNHDFQAALSTLASQLPKSTKSRKKKGR